MHSKIIRLIILLSLVSVAARPACALDPKLSTKLKQIVFSSQKQDSVLAFRLIEAGTGREIYSHQADQQVIPASVLKIITSVAALKFLGADHRFPTEIFVSKNPSEQDPRLDPSAGVASKSLSKASAKSPDIFIRGYGDPTLVQEDLLELARVVKAYGFNKVNNIIIDDTLFVDPLPASGPRAYNAGTSATSVNNNCYVVASAPSVSNGQAFVNLTPGLSYKLTNRLKTRSSKGVSINISQNPPSDSYNPKVVGRRLGTFSFFPEEKVSVQVSGKINAGSELQRKYYSVRNPPLYFGELFKYYLIIAGVNVRGSLLRGETPGYAKLIHTHKSDALKDILAKMNHYSSNHLASQVLFALGQDSSGYFRRDLGLERIRSVLTSLKFSKDDFNIVGASGLDRENRLTASQLVSVLAAAYQDFSILPDLISSFSRFGNSGTLKKRILYDPPEVTNFLPDSIIAKMDRRANSVWAKTGTLDGVSSLAGYALGRDNERFAFAIITNGAFTKDQSIEIEEKLIRAISEVRIR